jgi:hypothetical protein
MPATYTLAIFRPFRSNIIVPFTSQESDNRVAAEKAEAAARSFAAQYYHLSPAKGYSATFQLLAKDYLGGTDHAQLWLFPEDIAAKYGDRRAQPPSNMAWWWSPHGTVLLDADEAITLFLEEPEGYPVGESEALWSRNTKTHADLDAELDEWMGTVSTP